MELNRFYKLLIGYAIVGLLPFFGFSQNMVADTLIVAFNDTLKPALGSLSIEKVNDLRNTDSNFLSVYEKKKWLFFPVDQIVKTENPLARHVKQQYYSDSAGIAQYRVNINHFEIKNYTSLFGRQLILHSTLEISEQNEENDSTFIGTFYYEASETRKKKEPVAKSYEALLDKWSMRFGGDLLAVQNEIDKVVPAQYYHFRREQRAVGKNFYTSVEAFAGLNFWGVDGELWFSQPEANRIFNRSSGVIRYVNHPDFQAIAIGSNVRRWNYRLNQHWIFSNKMALLLGINNWKDIKTVGHKLEEILLFNASMTQSVNFNPLDKTGFVFGIGLMEDLHYVIYHNITFNLGISLNCAWKF
ncbi:MAG: hypothetical protein K9H26_06465 [Prolixibacteraceae bacterium]|nr:hypothetical protein [Prolixibacteraceae bacterium]